MDRIAYYKIFTICLIISIDFSEEYSFRRINQDSTVYLTLKPGISQNIFSSGYNGGLPFKIIVNGNIGTINSYNNQITNYLSSSSNNNITLI